MLTDQNIGTIFTTLRMFGRLVMRSAKIAVIYSKDGEVSTFELEEHWQVIPTRISEKIILDHGFQLLIQEQTVLWNYQILSDLSSSFYSYII